MILLGFANFQLSNRLEKPVAIYPSMTVVFSNIHNLEYQTGVREPPTEQGGAPESKALVGDLVGDLMGAEWNPARYQYLERKALKIMERRRDQYV